MSKKSLIVFAVVIVVLVVIGIWVGMRLSGSKNGSAESPYSAVYLSTGDIYFGNYSRFPSPHMTNVWYIQRGVDDQDQPQVGIAPFKGVFWGPVDRVEFNHKQIVLVTKLAADSQVVKAIENPQSGAPQTPGQGGAAIPPPTSTPSVPEAAPATP